MELRHLRYFVGVAEELNFTRAARRLRVAQPALSRQIQQLEDEVGVKLFDRNHRSVALTAAGKALLEESRAVLAQTQRAIEVAQNTGRIAAGHLNIGYVWGLFHSLVPGHLAAFRTQHPQVTVNLLDITATAQAEALISGELDVGFIGFAYEADAARLAKKCIGTCDFIATLPENHPASRKGKVPLAALASDFFIAISKATYPGAARYIHDSCERAGFRPRILHIADRGFTIPGLVAANCGVALVPEPLRALPHPGVVFRPLEDPPRGELFVAWNKSRRSVLRDKFIAALA
jgi:DNA-binding transcriptional LysR family regulator